MKKILFLAAVAATSTLFTSCNSCGNANGQCGEGIVYENDSIVAVNDSTIIDYQTFVFEGPLPMEDGTVQNCVLTIYAETLMDDGKYSMKTPMMSDSGNTMVVAGTLNDSTIYIYELSSVEGKPNNYFTMNSDTTLTRLNKNLKPISNNAAHKLHHKKGK